MSEFHLEVLHGWRTRHHVGRGVSLQSITVVPSSNLLPLLPRQPPDPIFASPKIAADVPLRKHFAIQEGTSIIPIRTITRSFASSCNLPFQEHHWIIQKEESTRISDQASGNVSSSLTPPVSTSAPNSMYLITVSSSFHFTPHPYLFA